MEDRRENRRIRMVSHLEVTFKDGGNTINAFTTNLSRNGLGFCTGKEVESGQDVDIKIYFNEKSDKQVSELISGKIKWVKQISRIYEAGVQFLETDLRKYPTLAQHVQHVMA